MIDDILFSKSELIEMGFKLEEDGGYEYLFIETPICILVSTDLSRNGNNLNEDELKVYVLGRKEIKDNFLSKREVLKYLR